MTRYRDAGHPASKFRNGRIARRVLNLPPETPRDPR